MKNLITLFLLTFFLTACANPKAYNLQGSIDDAKWNNQKVLLYGISEVTGLVALDSTVVEKNRFSLQGKVDSVGWYVLMIQNGAAQPIYKDFYIGGKLDCAVKNGKIRITGSDINDAYQAFDDQYTIMTAELIKLDELVKANPQDENAKNAFNASYATFLKSFRELSKKTILDNMETPLGIHIFQAALSTFENSDLEFILAKASPEFLKDGTVMMVKSQLEASKSVQEGSKCPDLKMMAPDGAQASLLQFIGKGNYVLIDFWASWCSPCMKELPNVLECYAQYHPKGFDIVGVSLDEDASAWKGAIEKNRIPWHHMSDLAGWKSQAVTVFSFSGIPHTVLVDPNGIIVAKNLRGEELKAKLAEIYK
ncbi:MAG TPA: TlpA disulfide reductase family protein [Bacteroidales bacterium]|nr:TlpA disulfide reductase family protein [Bacteroidales bacterium]